MRVSVYEIKSLFKIRCELEEMAEKEAFKLYRLAWRAKNHGCSDRTVEEIREEARQLHMTAYPEMLLDPCKTWKYAFR